MNYSSHESRTICVTSFCRKDSGSYMYCVTVSHELQFTWVTNYIYYAVHVAATIFPAEWCHIYSSWLTNHSPWVTWLTKYSPWVTNYIRYPVHAAATIFPAEWGHSWVTRYVCHELYESYTSAPQLGPFRSHIPYTSRTIRSCHYLSCRMKPLMSHQLWSGYN